MNKFVVFSFALATSVWCNHDNGASAQSMEDLIRQRDAAIKAMIPRLERVIITVDETKKDQLFSEAVAVAAAHGVTNVQFLPGERVGQKLILRGHHYFLTMDSPSSDREYIMSLYGTGQAFANGQGVLRSFLDRIKRAGVSKKVKFDKPRK